MVLRDASASKNTIRDGGSTTLYIAEGTIDPAPPQYIEDPPCQFSPKKSFFKAQNTHFGKFRNLDPPSP